jgi:Calcineurin-like phosphoesterase
VKATWLVVLGLVLVGTAVVLTQGAGSEDDGSSPSSRTTSAESESTAPGRAVASVNRPRAVVWAVGDGGIDSPQATRVARSIARSDADRLLYLGDVYPDGTPEDFEENYAPPYGRLAARTAPTPGNHEAPNADEGYYPYWERELGAPLAPYYDFSVAGWQILSLNSEIDHDPGSPQLRWLDRRVRRGGNCRIAFWHRPRFSAGTEHGDVTHVAPLWEALKGRARIVLNGHEHDMQRFPPRAGITEFVSGAGGASLSPVDESDPRLRFSNDSRYGALRLRLRRGRARHAFVTPSGRVLDKGTITCRK